MTDDILNELNFAIEIDPNRDKNYYRRGILPGGRHCEPELGQQDRTRVQELDGELRRGGAEQHNVEDAYIHDAG